MPGNEIKVHTSYRCITVDWSIAVVTVVVVVVVGGGGGGSGGGAFDAELTILCRTALGTNSTKRVITDDGYHSKSTFHVSNQTEQDRTIHTIFTSNNMASFCQHLMKL